MKKLYILVIALLIIGKVSFSQIILSENFSGGVVPSTFTMYCDAQTTYYTNFQGVAWTVGKYDFNVDTTNYVAASTSYFTSVLTADRWLVTPSLTIPAGSSYKFGFKCRNLDASYKDSLKVMVSTTGNAKANFTTTLFVSADDTIWTNHVLPLSSYAGQTIYVAIVNQSTDKYIVLIDNIQVGAGVGVNETTVENNYINIYPTSLVDNFNVSSSSNVKSIRIVNMLGQVVSNQQYNSKNITVNTSNLKAGVYFLQVESVTGKTSKKFIKQ